MEILPAVQDSNAVLSTKTVQAYLSLLKLPVYKQQVENYMPHQYLLQVMTVKFLQGQTTE